MRKKLLWGFIGVMIIAILGVMYASPYWTMRHIKAAIDQKDQEAIVSYIDFAQVKTGLQSQLKVMFLKEISENPDMANNPFAGFGVLMANAMIDGISDVFVSPEGIAALVQGKNAVSDAQQALSGQTEATSDQQKANDPLKNVNAGYAGVNRFDIAVPYQKGGTVTFQLKREHVIFWKLVHIQLPDAL